MNYFDKNGYQILQNDVLLFSRDGIQILLVGDINTSKPLDLLLNVNHLGNKSQTPFDSYASDDNKLTELEIIGHDGSQNDIDSILSFRCKTTDMFDSSNIRNIRQYVDDLLNAPLIKSQIWYIKLPKSDDVSEARIIDVTEKTVHFSVFPHVNPPKRYFIDDITFIELKVTESPRSSPHDW